MIQCQNTPNLSPAEHPEMKGAGAPAGVGEPCAGASALQQLTPSQLRG